MKGIMLSLLFAGILVACNNKKDHVLTNFIGSTVIIDTSKLVLTVGGKDTVVWDCLKKGNKMIVLLDSLGCSPCKLKSLSHWNPIISTLKSFEIEPVFIVCTNNENTVDVDISLKTIDFFYPIYIDKSSSVFKINKNIPRSNKYHVFFIDENNVVRIVGSPLQNKKILDLYVKYASKDKAKGMKS